MDTRPAHVVMLGLRGFPGVQGGVETHVEHLCPLLAQMGCRVDVIVRSPYQPADIGPEWRGVHFLRVWAPRSKGLEAIVHTFLGVLYAAARRPDILHIHAIGPSIMTPLARLFGLKVVVTHHGPDYERQKWGVFARLILRTGERFGMRFSHRRIAISDGIRNLVRDKYGLESALIPNGVELPQPTHGTATLRAFDLAQGRYVLLVSRLVPEKRHHDLIQAFVLARLDGWKLVLVGAADHPDAYARSVLDAASASPNVVCVGFQVGVGLRELYAHAGMYVLPSSHEGLPITLLEALSYGLPVIASDIPSNREIACAEIRYYPLGNVRALAAALRARADEPADSGSGERSRQFVAEKYRWRDIAQKTIAVYATAMRGTEAEPKQ